MVGGQREENLVDQNNMLKVVNDRLSVEEVHGCCEPIPIQALGRSERSRATGNIGDGDDFLEGNDLDCSDDADDVNMAHEECAEKDDKHDQGPKGSGDEVGLFLLILGLFLFGRCLRSLSSRCQRMRFPRGFSKTTSKRRTSSTVVSEPCVRSFTGDPPSLFSLKLALRSPLAMPLAVLPGNLTPRFGLAIVTWDV